MNYQNYLERIGITGPVVPNEENLIRITRAHLEAVPFENLQVVYEHMEPSLEPEDLFNKVVNNKRGGYCFELNKLFCLLLKELGYNCISVPARVVHKREELRPVSHRATLVYLDGKKWFCDVGFGGAGPKGAIRVDTLEPQTVFGDTFFVSYEMDDYVGEIGIFRVDDGIPERVMTFREMSWMDADFATLNSFYATYPRSPFMLKRVLYRCVNNGWHSLVDKTLVSYIDGNRQTVELQTEQQVQDVIGQYFDLFVTPVN